MEDKVRIKSLVSNRVFISIPEIRLSRVWEKKGTVKTIPFEQLEEAIYNPGVEAMFRDGILGIEDMDVKIKLGLEPEGATEPVNIIMLDDPQIKRYLTVLPIHEFREKIKELSHDQIVEIASYAIANEIANFEKSEIIKALTGIDIIKAIQLNRDDLAAQKEE